MALRRNPSPKLVRSLLAYDRETGVLTWRVRVATRVHIGDVAGCASPGKYRTIAIKGRPFQAGRLAWVIVKGRWPKGEIDRRNLDKHDDRWANLREATLSQSRANRSRRPDNKTGFRGVSVKRGGRASGRRFSATIQAAGEQRHIGYFGTAEEAAAAYAKASAELHGEFGRVS